MTPNDVLQLSVGVRRHTCASENRTLKLPNADTAILPPEKLRDYLLSPSHPIGRYKAAFFRSLGYGPDSWEKLRKDLLGLLSNEAELAGESDFGKKYAVRGAITGPTGAVAEIVAVWIILKGEETPRFVTAYPES